MHYFSIFVKNFNKPCANFFERFDDKLKLLGNFQKILKIFDEHSIEKLTFYLIFIFILENLLLKIEPSEITPFFHIFRFRGGGEFSPSPWLRPWSDWTLAQIDNYKSQL